MRGHENAATPGREYGRFTRTRASHSKTILYGLITTDGRGMFRLYDKFNQHAFADVLMQAVYKFKKICLIHGTRPPSTGQQRYANWLREQTAWR